MPIGASYLTGSGPTSLLRFFEILHGRHHGREGLCGQLAAAGAGDVRAAGASAGACTGRHRRGDRHHRRVERKIHFFAFDLPHSDACFVAAYPAETKEAFCDGHVKAFSFFGGVPRSILYDNKAADRGNEPTNYAHGPGGTSDGRTDWSSRARRHRDHFPQRSGFGPTVCRQTSCQHESPGKPATNLTRGPRCGDTFL